MPTHRPPSLRQHQPQVPPQPKVQEGQEGTTPLPAKSPPRPSFGGIKTHKPDCKCAVCNHAAHNQKRKDAYAVNDPPPEADDEQKARLFQREARRHTKKALANIAKLADESTDDRVKFQANKLLLDIAYGRPATQPAPQETPDPIRLLPGDEKL